jgi:hypothetical protein
VKYPLLGNYLECGSLCMSSGSSLYSLAFLMLSREEGTKLGIQRSVMVSSGSGVGVRVDVCRG